MFLSAIREYFVVSSIIFELFRKKQIYIITESLICYSHDKTCLNLLQQHVNLLLVHCAAEIFIWY